LDILVPIRFPITNQNIRTVKKAKEIASNGGYITMLHINLFQHGERVTENELRNEIEGKIGGIDANYMVREGFVVEESILEEIVKLKPDIVVIGKNQESKLKKIFKKFMYDIDIENFLMKKCDCDIEIVE